MAPLKKGDPCRVRLHTGEVVEAVYDKPSIIEKDHFVKVEGKTYRATSWPDITENMITECRFVGNPCLLVPVGVSV